MWRLWVTRRVILKDKVVIIVKSIGNALDDFDLVIHPL